MKDDECHHLLGEQISDQFRHSSVFLLKRKQRVMMNMLTYAGCIHRFAINENGCIQIDIFGYDNNTERFRNTIDKPLIPSTTMKFTKCTTAASCLMDKGLGVLLHVITSNSSVLMFLHLQSRPWSCQIIYTLSLPTLTYGSARFLAMNSFMTVFISEDKKCNGFYIIDNKQQKCQRNIESISCSLLTYVYCYLKGNYYWLMGGEIDWSTERKLIKVYYGYSTSPSTPLVAFDTHQFIPLTLVDNIQDIYIINHKLQLKPRVVLGDVIISSRDHRIFACHHGTITHELAMTNLITSIQSYFTIENDQLFLFSKKDIQSIEIFQYDENLHLVPYTNSNETADSILMDDFAQIGWKQILFLKNSSDLNSFMLTDFSQIHVFPQGSDYEYHTEEKRLSMDIDDVDVQSSLILAQNILRKKIINADFIVNEGYYQCKQIENDIRKVSNKHHIPDLSIQSDSLTQNSNHSTSTVQLIDTNWFIYRTNLYLYATIKNASNAILTSVHLFGVDKHSNKIKLFNLKTGSQSSLNEQTIFSLNPQTTLTFILTTVIELDKDIDIDLYLLSNDSNKLFHVGSIAITIDDLINLNNGRLLKINALENESKGDLMCRQAFIYLHTLFRLNVNIESTSKFQLIEHFRQLLSTIGFKQIIHLSNVWIRVNEGNIFENVLIHLVNEDDLIADDLGVHIYAKNSYEATMIAKYILSKLDFQTFSVIDSMNSKSDRENSETLRRIQVELTSYLDAFKGIPTIMRKIAPTSKSESYRLFKSENFQSFQNECRLTDLFLASLIID